MASLRKLSRVVKPLLSCRRIVAPACVRNAAYWNKDWMPGEHPETPEARAAAAKKYNLLPEDYKPHPDDGFARGDYPDLPLDPWELKDPWEDYDFPRERRNFGDPLQEDFDISWAYFHNIRDDDDKFWHNEIPGEKRDFFVYLSIYLGYAFWLWWFYHYKGYIHEYRMGPKQFPDEGVTHYTFEPVET